MLGERTPLSPRGVQKVKKEENKEVGKDTLEKTHIQMERKYDVEGEKLYRSPEKGT